MLHPKYPSLPKYFVSHSLCILMFKGVIYIARNIFFPRFIRIKILSESLFLLCLFFRYFFFAVGKHKVTPWFSSHPSEHSVLTGSVLCAGYIKTCLYVFRESPHLKLPVLYLSMAPQTALFPSHCADPPRTSAHWVISTNLPSTSTHMGRESSAPFSSPNELLSLWVIIY